MLLATAAPVKEQIALLQHRVVMPPCFQDEVIKGIEAHLSVEGDVLVFVRIFMPTGFQVYWRLPLEFSIHDFAGLF